MKSGKSISNHWRQVGGGFEVILLGAVGTHRPQNKPFFSPTTSTAKRGNTLLRLRQGSKREERP